MLAYYSKGAINIDIAYTLPIHLRRYYLNLINEIHNKEKEMMEEAQNKSPGKKVDKPF